MGDILALTALVAEDELKAAFGQLDTHLQTKSLRDERPAHFRPRTPAGPSGPGVYWFPEAGYWAQLGIEWSGTRYWCACGVSSPFEKAQGVPICEINPPLEGKGAGTKGAFAKDEAGRIYLLHTGKFGGRYIALPAQAFMEVYEGAQARVSWPASVGGGSRRMCVVGRLDDQQLVASIGAFVHAVARFKDQMHDQRTPPETSRVPIGQPYTDQREPPRSEDRRQSSIPYAVDPDIVGRGVRAHWETQSKLVRYLRDELALIHEGDILEWAGSHLLYDLVWRTRGDVYWVAEVKSLTKVNEDHQLRLGLGQVLQYRWWLSKTYRTIAKDVRAVLVVEGPPERASDWQAICREAGVILVWPDVLALLAEHVRDAK